MFVHFSENSSNYVLFITLQAIFFCIIPLSIVILSLGNIIFKLINCVHIAMVMIAPTLVHVREGGMEEFVERRRGMLDTGEWSNPVSNMLRELLYALNILMVFISLSMIFAS